MQFFQINISKHQTINCSLYNAVASDKIMIIVSATGVLQSFYKKIVAFFQTNSISTIMFDYAGIGKSLHGNINNENSSLINWGSRDLEAVIKYTIDTFPNHKNILLSHSIGGPLIGLTLSPYMSDKLILVASKYEHK